MNKNIEIQVIFEFPSPLEVDRYLYTSRLPKFNADDTFRFPSPLEVDRYLYEQTRNSGSFRRMFPSPLEVDRYLYSFF